MKNIFTMGLIMAICVPSFGQLNQKFAVSTTQARLGSVPDATKAAGDTITMETFDPGQTWGTWTASNQNDHTAGDWYLETTFPPSLSGQPQIPFTSFSGGMSGNVAFINSDAEGASAFQDALYTSPAIDLSAYSDSVLSLTWTSQWRRFQELHYVYVSNDNGATWTEFAVDVVPVNTNSDDPDYPNLNITAAIGGGTWSNNVLIRFRYDAQWDWFWAVDNVAVIETPANDLVIESIKHRFTAGKVQHSKIPTAQVTDMTFEATVYNNGSQDQTNAQLDVGITSPLVFNGSSTPINVPSGATSEFSLNGLNPGSIGVYDIQYNVYDPSTTDITPGDNLMTSSFERTSYIFAKDTNILNGWYGHWDDDGDGLKDPKEFLPRYDVVNPMIVESLLVVLMDQTPVGQEIYYNMTIDDGAGNQVLVFDGLTIPIPSYTVTAADLTSTAGSEVWIDLPYPIDIAVPVGASGEFYPVVGYSIDSMFMAVSGTALDTTNFINVFGSTAGQTPYFIEDVPMIRIGVKPNGLEEEDAAYFLSQNVPNPFNALTQIPFRLDKSADVDLLISDLMGKVIERKSLGRLSTGQHTIEFDGGKLAAGFYNYSLMVNGQQITKRMIVER